MKSLLTLAFLTAALALSASAQAQSDNVRLEFGPTSKIWVTGTSTIHDWHCNVVKPTGQITADVTSGLKGVAATKVTVPVSAIDCDSKKMNGKVEDALNDGNKTPNISFVLSKATVSGSTVSVTGDLTIAGSTRSVQFDVTGAPSADNTMTFTGSVPVLMSDHGVDPPTAMLGTLKTGDEVVVHFEVVTSLPNAQ